ncbi:hypothetical protein [Streptosporangium amethystogenes]|uniref:hypothetical protein n=1 Tax=Streptosporangium amethystogenes TaxID=2002 RepID=UPI00069006E3|nr:hypothetical protein [Streptosporangium amethystogenes]
MTDPHHVLDTSETARPVGMLRPVLWFLLVVSAALNMVTSSIDVGIFVGIGFGLVALACATTLIVHHYRYRRTCATTRYGQGWRSWPRTSGPRR